MLVLDLDLDLEVLNMYLRTRMKFVGQYVSRSIHYKPEQFDASHAMCSTRTTVVAVVDVERHHQRHTATDNERLVSDIPIKPLLELTLHYLSAICTSKNNLTIVYTDRL